MMNSFVARGCGNCARYQTPLNENSCRDAVRLPPRPLAGGKLTNRLVWTRAFQRQRQAGNDEINLGADFGQALVG